MSIVSLEIDLSKIRTTDGKVLFTYSDICKLPEWPEGPLLEIYKGDIFNVPSPNIKHQRISKNVEKILDNYVEKNQ